MKQQSGTALNSLLPFTQLALAEGDYIIPHYQSRESFSQDLEAHSSPSKAQNSVLSKTGRNHDSMQASSRLAMVWVSVKLVLPLPEHRLYRQGMVLLRTVENTFPIRTRSKNIRGVTVPAHLEAPRLEKSEKNLPAQNAYTIKGKLNFRGYQSRRPGEDLTKRHCKK